MQGIQVHLRARDGSRSTRERAVVHACDHVVAIGEDSLLEGRGLGEGRAVNLHVNRDVVAKQATVEVNDVRLAAMHKAHALPDFGPRAEVEEELEVSHALLGEEHAAEVLGIAQNLDAPLGGGENVLANGRVRVAGEERVGVNVAAVSEHGHLPTCTPPPAPARRAAS